MADAEAQKNSDLGPRVLSAIGMVAVSGTALWLGGAAWILFVGVVAAISLFEWRRLALGVSSDTITRIAWITGGVLYIGAAAAILLLFRRIGIPHVAFPVLVTIFTDTGAYFAGRTFGGPKIAPRVSPSKTWSGLVGGMLAAGAVGAWWTGQFAYHGAWIVVPVATGFVAGAALAIVAQAGDFLESWMKRRAGLKDSGSIIPGHGGILDRIDGLLAVLLACGIAWVILAGAVVE